MLARCLQHETDHLDGVLFIDRMDAATRKRAMKEIREANWGGAGEDEPASDDRPHILTPSADVPRSRIEHRKLRCSLASVGYRGCNDSFMRGG